jgi:hypothetical protein
MKGLNFNPAHKQNTKQRKEKLKKNLCCWMKLVGIAPSSSICIRK